MLTATAPGLAQVGTEQAGAKTPKIETTYNSGKDKTTVRMMPMQISGDKGRYHSLTEFNESKGACQLVGLL